jgi:hypothetical protein
MRNVFKYDDRVRVKMPGKRAFVGKVYSQYLARGPTLAIECGT